MANHLLRLPMLQNVRQGKLRTARCAIIWHDTTDGALAAQRQVVAQEGAVWRLESLRPEKTISCVASAWLPAQPAPVLAEARGLDGLCIALNAPLTHVASFTGRTRSLDLMLENTQALLLLREGTLRSLAGDQPAARLVLAGDPRTLAKFSRDLARSVALHPPLASLAAAAMDFARGTQLVPRRTGAALIPAGASLQEAFVAVTAHLTDILQFYALLVPTAADPEPVHQMRVAARRLRSALAMLSGAIADQAWILALDTQIKTLAGHLGAARDWDVFITETMPRITAALAQDARMTQMIVAARRKQAAAYQHLAAYFASNMWHQLALEMALLPAEQPWGALASPAAPFAAHSLNRQLKKILRAGPDLSVHPVEQLHSIRKQAKKLRYGIEIFSLQFPEKRVRKYLRQLERLQEAFGAVNDSAQATQLIHQLGSGTARAFACGVVVGFGCATCAGASQLLQRRWNRFYRADPFWD